MYNKRSCSRPCPAQTYTDSSIAPRIGIPSLVTGLKQSCSLTADAPSRVLLSRLAEVASFLMLFFFNRNVTSLAEAGNSTPPFSPAMYKVPSGRGNSSGEPVNV